MHIAADRFWSKVQRGGPTDCWRWLASHSRTGYGQFMVGRFRDRDNRPIRAHRIAWMLTHGAIQADQCVLHRCDVRDCCNPDHLFLGSQQDNMRDMREKGRGPINSGAKGARNVHAKLTDEIIRTIRQRRANGDSGPDVARSYGLNRSTVNKIASGKAWKHVV